LEIDMQLNTFSISGYVGRDPDVKYFTSGTVKAGISLAVRRPGTKDGTDWIAVEFWGKTAEVVANFVRKGSYIEVSGRLSIQTWTDRDTNEPRSKPVLKADGFQFGPKTGGSNDEF